MNNEETIIMQPQNNKKAEEVKNIVETPEAPAAEPVKKEKKTGKGKKVDATVGAAAMGGAVGGAGTVAAANHMSNAEDTEEVEAEVVEEAAAPVAEAKPEPEPAVEEKEEIVENVPEDETEPDYPQANGADPVTPQPTPTNNASGEEGGEVVVLGIEEGYTEDGTHVEAAYLTDGETIAAVVDYDGDGEANIIAIDENVNGQIEENEIYDIAEQHVEMDAFEQQYLAQQQMAEQEQQDTFAYNASDETDYNNDVEVYDI